MRLVFAIVCVLLTVSTSFAGFGRSSFRSFSRPSSFSRSWSSSRSSYSYKPSSSFSTPKPAPSFSRPAHVVSPARSSVNWSHVALTAGTVYLLTRNSNSSAPLNKECKCNEQGVPENCPSDVQCKKGEKK